MFTSRGRHLLAECRRESSSMAFGLVRGGGGRGIRTHEERAPSGFQDHDGTRCDLRERWRRRIWTCIGRGCLDRRLMGLLMPPIESKTDGSHRARVASWDPTSRPAAEIARDPERFLGRRHSAAPLPGTRPPAAPLPGTRPATAPVPGTRPPAAPIPGARPAAAPLPGTPPAAAPVPG